MRLCLLITCLLVCASTSTMKKFLNIVKQDEIKFSKDFPFDKAFANFKKNFRKLKSSPVVGKSYRTGLSAVDMLSKRQFRRSMGARMNKHLQLPLFVDNRNKGLGRKTRNEVSSYTRYMRMFDATRQLLVNEVVNQGVCGNCYLHTTIAAIEVAYGKISGKRVKFSEQELTDCYYRGCGGGDFREVSKTLAAINKLSAREKYGDYLSKVDQCRMAVTPDDLDVMKLGGVMKVTADTVEAALIKHGSVMTCMDWEHDCIHIKEYSGGIFEGPYSAKCDHAVLIVGFTPSYYKVRNSHGKSWGEGGYFRIRRGNTCGIENYMAALVYSHTDEDKGNMNNGCPVDKPMYCDSIKSCTSKPCLTFEHKKVENTDQVCKDDESGQNTLPCDKMLKFGFCDIEEYYHFCYVTCDKCDEFYKKVRPAGASAVPLVGDRKVQLGPCNLPHIEHGRVLSKTTFIESGTKLAVECDPGYTRTGSDVVCIVQDSFGPDTRLMPECHKVVDADLVGNGTDYMGSKEESFSGKPCLNWNQIILSGEYKGSLNRKKLMIGNHNYCRNPGGLQVAPMCIVDGSGSLEYCFSGPGCDTCDTVARGADQDESCYEMEPFCKFEYQIRNSQYEQAWRECPNTCCISAGCHT